MGGKAVAAAASAIALNYCSLAWYRTPPAILYIRLRALTRCSGGAQRWACVGNEDRMISAHGGAASVSSGRLLLLLVCQCLKYGVTQVLSIFGELRLHAGW
jgi:hypothetical protein